MAQKIQSDDINVLNLKYDLTMAENISMIVCEIGKIPCQSVPVIIREFDQKKSDRDPILEAYLLNKS
jgi:translation initiation factor 2B subunit (eIF-2B alpha/beta/delta family)